VWTSCRWRPLALYYYITSLTLRFIQNTQSAARRAYKVWQKLVIVVVVTFHGHVITRLVVKFSFNVSFLHSLGFVLYVHLDPVVMLCYFICGVYYTSSILLFTISCFVVLLFLVLHCNWSCLAVVKHINKLSELLLYFLIIVNNWYHVVCKTLLCNILNYSFVLFLIGLAKYFSVYCDIRYSRPSL
jgi:hypothetical protein